MFINRLFGISVFLFIYLSLPRLNSMFLCIVLCFIYWVIYRDYYTLLIILFLLIPTNIPTRFLGNEGRVIDVRPTYFVMEHNQAKIVIYDSNHRVSFDDYVEVKGQVKPIEVSSHFDAFNYNANLLNMGVSSTMFATNTVITEEGNTIRHHLYNYIQSIENLSIKELYLKFVFNIKTDSLHELFLELGLCYFGLLECIRLVLKFRFSFKVIKLVQLIVIIAFIIILGPSFILVRLLIGLIISYLRLDKFKRFTLWFIILMILYPNYIHSVAFIFPLAFRLIAVFKSTNQKTFGYLISSLIQGVFFLKANIISIFFYQYLARFYGFIFFVLLLMLPFNQLLIHILPILNHVLNFLTDMNYTVVGKPNLIAFIFVIIGFKFIKTPLVLTIIYLFLMSISGFNLFYEVTFINIGQGDSILITTPFNKTTILYDTGKLNQYQLLRANLQAKGIHRIDYLIISHQDEDHDGSKLKLIEEYNVIQVIEQCVDIQVNSVALSCLTPKAKGIDNDDSLVYQLQVNNFMFLLTGDISTEIERDLIRKYQLSIDVLKVAHHGSKTSSSKQFLEAIKPSIAIISTNGQYNHPSSFVTDTLTKLSIPIKITKNSGDIRFVLFDFVNFMHTSNQEFGIIRR